jgi:hypothetical protein
MARPPTAETDWTVMPVVDGKVFIIFRQIF